MRCSKLLFAIKNHEKMCGLGKQPVKSVFNLRGLFTFLGISIGGILTYDYFVVFSSIRKDKRVKDI